ncbi:MAG: hypothetical protein LKJ94_07665 [Candidatus Methanomethylophilus sp.]|jgi:hypothetical protein|nr:hypothetical protein [Methanomethylophilus sp.]MCI2075548.1 hypothetical protein [Methanomethylophilus sp.]MCI2093370.1 hypothetical protein [Methanomethylophilus sp.]
MKVCYEVRGDRRYAYRVTSKREPGKKYPTTVKEYLGVVDPGTGTCLRLVTITTPQPLIIVCQQL